MSLITALAVVSLTAAGQTQPVDVESTRLIREYTTEPGFRTEWVETIPESETVPSPRDFLGYVVGTPRKLTQPSVINDYFRKLAETSDRVQVFSMGRSHGGREMIVAAIADAGVLGRLEVIVAANRRLADPRATTRIDAEAVAASMPPTYWITAGLHSTETGPPEMVMELAYRLAVSERPHIREIRAGVLTLISPVLEMDGRARMVDWYDRYLTEVEDLRDSPPGSPPYWGDYTLHDNNRDGLQVSQPLTRNYTETYHRFLPTVSLDLHESVPLLYASMGTGPYNDTIDPITVTEWLWMSSWDVSRATSLGLRGVWTWGFYTGWYPGYLLWVTNNHNAVGRFYETFGNSNAGTFERELKRARYAGKRVDTRQWYRPWPPEKKLRWSLRNNTNYMQTGVLAALQLAARQGETLLLNFWQKGRNALDRGRSEPPYAFVIPRGQRDRGSLHHLLWLLRQHRIEVHEAVYGAAMSGGSMQKGDFVVRMDQPYASFAGTLLSPREFPETAELAPYDDVAWSLDLMLGVEVQPIDDPGVLEMAMTPLASVPALPGRAEPGGAWIVEHRGQQRVASLRWALGDDARVEALAAPWAGRPAGSLVIRGIDAGTAQRLAREHHLDLDALAGDPEVDTVEVDLPRIALFHTWSYTQDSGWARYALEQLGIPFTLINKDHLRAGDLGRDFDVIIVPDQGRRTLRDIVHGLDPKWGPMAYTNTPEYPSHGVIDSTDDLTGGMGFTGLGHIESFVRSGGVLITLASAGRLAVDGGLTRRVRSEPPAVTPGSHVTVKVLRPEHPVAWGFDETTWVFRGRDPRFTVPEFWQGLAVLQYGTKTMAEAEREADRKAGAPVDEPAADAEGSAPDRPPLCLSGIVREPESIERVPAVLDVPVAQGRVLIYSWNPVHRYQNHHDFPFLTNALLFYNDMPETPMLEEMKRREEQEP